MDLSSPPSIRISRSPRQPSPRTHHTPIQPFRHAAASPMAIPSRERTLAPPPPPLPPPTNVEELGLTTHEPSWPFNNNPHWQGFSASGRPDITIDGRSRKNSDERLSTCHEIDPTRKASSAHTIISAPQRASHDMEEGRRTSGDEATFGTSPINSKLHSERQLERKALNTSSQAYDRNLLSKIGGPNTPLRLPSISSISGENAGSSPANSDTRAPVIQRLSMSERRRSSNDSRFSSRQSSTTGSLFSTPSFRSNSIFESPEISRAAGKRQPSLNFDEALSHRGSSDSNMFYQDDNAMEGSRMRDLNISDGASADSDDYLVGPRVGMKRRASSPQREPNRSERSSIGPALGATDLYHRRSLQHPPPRSSPAARTHYQHHSSISSVSSYGPRTASLSSSHGLSVASSVTSLGSGRLSPSALSTHLDPELGPPFYASKSLNPSPRSSIASHPISRQALETAAHGATAAMAEATAHGPPMSGLLICECCPKKPKKFSNEDELRLHQMEKQYSCAYCPNRFKNKNEAERHQNSLHLRRHSWSCAALPSIQAAFYQSQNGNDTAACGYCGEEFSNPPDWEARRNHVSAVHKFGECNQVKKFFRADHFRQHLKHSHGGTSGKWTNQLENMCMRDEPLPQPINRASAGGGPGYYGGSGPTLPPPVIGGAVPPKPETIDEVPQER